MGLWSLIQRKLWTGRVVQDNPVSERRIGISRRRVSLLATDKDGGRIFIKESWAAPIAASVRFIELTPAEAFRLDAALHEALACFPSGVPNSMATRSDD
jgi:hypothetical protein